MKATRRGFLKGMAATAAGAGVIAVVGKASAAPLPKMEVGTMYGVKFIETRPASTMIVQPSEGAMRVWSKRLMSEMRKNSFLVG